MPKLYRQSGFGGGGIIVLILVALLILGFMGWRFWLSKEAELSRSNKNSEASKTETTIQTDDEKVIVAAEIYCKRNDANLDFQIGKSPSGKSVLYSTDRQFAKLNVHCAPKNIPYGGIEYTLKKNNGIWELLYASIDDTSALAQQYGVPDKFE